ncbi:MAG: putative LPS assembly protein LptD [Chryseolinea sp.]
MTLKLLEEFSKVIATSSAVNPIFLTALTMFRVFAIPLCKIVNFSLKGKGPADNFLPVQRAVIFIFFVVCAHSTLAQLEPRVKTPPGLLPVKADTVKTPSAPRDSVLIASDTLKKPHDSVSVQRRGDIETTINYSAKDSIRASIDGKLVWLYGDAKIVYGEIELEAEEIMIDYANSTLSAHGIRDSLGQRVGYPVFKNGSELYETKDIIYNFKTKRARITEVVTTQGDSYLHGDIVYKNEKGELLSIRNSYTTCNLEHPHYEIKATKTKAIPNDKIVAGPFYVQFNDIPLPLGFLFGMFPSPQRSASGIIVPQYGEERRRGFNLRNGGYFFDISEYWKLALTGDVYSKGGHALYVNSNYMKRYKYTGTVNFGYSKNPDGDDKIETKNFTEDFRITWTHSPQSKGTGRFSASVNAATSTYNQNNYLGYGTQGGTYNNPNLNNITAKLSSNISYSKRFGTSPFSMGVNVSHNQDLQTKVVDLLLPNISLNMTNIYPFQRKDGRTGPLDNLSVSYSMAAMNRVTNNLGRIPPTATKDSIAAFNMSNFSKFFADGRKGMRHQIPTSFSFKVLRFLTISPSFNYEEKWYGEQITWDYASETDSTVVKKSIDKGFHRVANYSVSAGLTTRIYGMYTMKNKMSSIKAIRHVVNPSISFGYTPDYRGNTDYFTALEKKYTTDPANNQTIYYDRYQGSVYGGSTLGRSGAIGFGIGNNLEMKVQKPADSVARKVMILNNLSINSSYNIMADSFKLAPFSISANTNILNNLINLNVSTSIDPYSIFTDGEGVQTRTKNYAWKSGQGLGRITTATMALSTNLNPKARSKDTSSREKISKSDLPEQEKQFLLANPDAYVDFEIPWSMNISYNLSYSNPLNSSPQVTQTINMQGDVSLSAAWKVTYSTGFHFESKEFTQTNFGIARDLHCWTLRLNWTPFGRFQQYNFTIAVKSSILSDLKLERRKPFFDNL